jgi:hypothetical protein
MGLDSVRIHEKVCVEFHTKRNSEEKGFYMFVRRLGQSDGRSCGHNCPQILEMKDGDFAAVGLDITERAAPAMPPGPGVGSGERVVRIPRHVMISARADIPPA